MNDPIPHPEPGTPMDTESLKQFLDSGPQVEEHPPAPSPSPSVPEQQVQASPQSDVSSSKNEDDDKAAQADYIMPSEEEKARLKKSYGSDLKVVPIPYSGPNNKWQCYVIRPLTSAQWRAMEVQAQKIAENKPDVPYERILADKIVSTAIVWPQISEVDYASLKAGLVPTIYGVVQQMCLFFNPDVVAQLAFAL